MPAFKLSPSMRAGQINPDPGPGAEPNLYARISELERLIYNYMDVDGVATKDIPLITDIFRKYQP